MDKLIRMLQLQSQLQHDTYGYNFATMTKDELIRYIKDQHQALVMEACEVLDEVPWKPWARGDRDYNRDAFMGELIDVLHFWLNLALAVSGSTTAEELASEIFTRFTLKNAVNAQRQVEGYDGISTKCGGCGRALDDVAVQCTREGDQGYCAQTDTDVNYVVSWADKAVIKLPVITPTTPTVPTYSLVCEFCKNSINEFGCVPATVDRWGHCGTDQRQLPPIKLPTT